MHLLDHNRILVDLVLETLVQSDVNAAFVARGACKYFKDKIENELITNTSLSRLLDLPAQKSRVCVWIRKEQNATAFLTYRLQYRQARPNSSQELPCFMNRVAEELLRHVPAGVTKSTIRAQYQKNIVRVLALNIRYFEDEHDGAPIFVRWVSDLMNGDPVSDVMMLHAAAAVGDLKVIEQYLSSTRCFWTRSIFSNVWCAAVRADVPKSMRFLLGRLRICIESPEQTSKPALIHEKLRPIILKAYEHSVISNRIEIAKLLIEFMAKYDYFGKHRIDKEAIRLPMAHGAFEILDYVHKAIPNIRKRLESYSMVFGMGFELACRNNHGAFVTRLLQSHYKPSILLVEDYLLIAATSDRRLSVLKALLDCYDVHRMREDLMRWAVFGTTQEPEKQVPAHVLRGDNRWYRIRGSSFANVQLLIERDIPVAGKMVELINYLAKFIMARDDLNTDLSMKLIFILDDFKSRCYDARQLCRQMQAPVRRALTRFLAERPTVWEIGAHHIDFYKVAQDLSDWFRRHDARTRVA